MSAQGHNMAEVGIEPPDLSLQSPISTTRPPHSPGNSIISGRIWLKFKLIQAFMHVLVCCKNGEDPIKNEGTRMFTTFLPL